MRVRFSLVAKMDDFNIFDLEDEFSNQDSKVQIIPVPWEASTSFKKGTIEGPDAIFEASIQMDLCDFHVKDPYKQGYFMMDEDLTIRLLSRTAQRTKEDKHFEVMNQYVQRLTKEKLDKEQIPVILGGDHSVPLGAYKAVAESVGDFGILHIDAHMDLRDGYQNFTYSHASIMRHALKIPQLKSLVQIGIRDFCEEELECSRSEDRIETIFDHDLSNLKIEGKSWASLLKKKIKHLPKKVWISLDIDGLCPSLCPGTGTPVPGGLGFNEVLYIIRTLCKSKNIIGFDLVEVGPREIDANVGMRLLYKIGAYALESRGFCTRNIQTG